MAWYWIVLIVIGYVIAGGLTVTVFELTFDEIDYFAAIPIALAWPVTLLMCLMMATERVSLKAVRRFVEQREINKYAKTRKLKGNTNMKIETIEKYLRALKNGTPAEVKDKPVWPPVSLQK